MAIVSPARVYLTEEEIIDILERHLMEQGYALAEGHTTQCSIPDGASIYVESSIPVLKEK